MYDPTSEQALRERHFVEELGHMFADLGAVPMMGRVMGRLLICDPPEQSLTELSEYLGASKGSISTTARQMLAAGMIQKVPRPGDRAHYYRISDDAFSVVSKARLAHTTLIREKAEQGLALISDKPDHVRARLQHMVDFYRFFEHEMPRLLARWQASREDR